MSFIAPNSHAMWFSCIIQIIFNAKHLLGLIFIHYKSTAEEILNKPMLEMKSKIILYNAKEKLHI